MYTEAMNQVGSIPASYLNRELGLNSWREFFTNRAKAESIFNSTRHSNLFQTTVSASVIGNKWLSFSELMPKILCLLASKVNSNQARMRILKIAWEELGEGHSEHIHPETFKDCLQLAQVEITEKHSSALDHLEEIVGTKITNTTQVFGFGLGLEIIAVENIQILFDGLNYTDSRAEQLKDTDFFKIHFKNEDGHINHCVESFINYCDSGKSRMDFIVGFDYAIEFWHQFWAEVTEDMEDFNIQRGKQWLN